MDEPRKYQFTWDLLGDLDQGRPNLGQFARLEVYRLMQFCFRDVVEQRLGSDETDRIFHDAGYKAGQEFFNHIVGDIKDLNEFVSRLQLLLKEMGIGILRVEKANPVEGSFVLTVSEDMDCSGLPDVDDTVCTYDEGFIRALMESFTGQKFIVKEIDCWCTGERTCRFSAEVQR